MTNPYRAPSETDSDQHQVKNSDGQDRSRVWIGWAMLSTACIGSSGLMTPINARMELINLSLFVAGVIFAMLAVLSQTDRGKRKIDAGASQGANQASDGTSSSY